MSQTDWQLVSRLQTSGFKLGWAKTFRKWYETPHHHCHKLSLKKNENCGLRGLNKVNKLWKEATSCHLHVLWSLSFFITWQGNILWLNMFGQHKTCWVYLRPILSPCWYLRGPSALKFSLNMKKSIYICVAAHFCTYYKWPEHDHKMGKIWSHQGLNNSPLHVFSAKNTISDS